MRPALRTSGDFLADRRYGYGAGAARAGDHAAAAELFEQAIERAPHWADAFLALGRAQCAGGDLARAMRSFRAGLALEPADALGFGLELARLGESAIGAAPPAYVAALFDAYAEDFDAALVGRLGYRAPALIAEAVTRGGRRFAHALDLGCGTGLAGAALRASVDRLEGVDLSSRMIARAKDKRIYDALETASLADRLAREDGAFDLIVAADVFSYLGDLGPTLGAVARRLEPAGLAAFTVEKSDGDGWALLASLRFAHSEAYIRAIASESGLEIISTAQAPLRLDRGEPVLGLIVVGARFDG